MGKFTITLHVFQEGILTPGPSIDYTFTASALSSQIVSICTSFEESGNQMSDPKENYCIQTKKGNIIDTKSSLTIQLSECESNALDLLVHPEIRTQRAIDLVTDTNTKGFALKEALFSLRSQLLDYNFVQSFVRKNGLEVLFNVLRNTTGNSQGYCLGAIRNCLSNLSAMTSLLNSPDSIQYLYSLIHSNTLSVCRQSMEMLCAACTFDEHAGVKIFNAAKAISGGRENHLFSYLVKLVSSKDLGTQLNSITLINNLIQTIPSEEEREVVLNHLEEDLHFRDILKECTYIGDEKFSHQLQFYENITGQSVLEYSSEDIKRQLKEYQLQQPLFNIIRNELQRAQHAISESLTVANYLPISAEEPLKRYSERMQVLEEEFNDRSAVGGTAMSIAHEELKEENRKLETQLETLKQTIETLTENNSTLLEQNAALHEKLSSTESNNSSISQDISSEMQQYTELKAGAEKAIETLRAEKEELRKMKLTKQTKPSVCEEIVSKERSKGSVCGEFDGEETQSAAVPSSSLLQSTTETQKLQEEIDTLRSELQSQDVKYKHKIAAYHKRMQDLTELLQNKKILLSTLSEQEISSQTQITKLKQLMRAMKLQYDAMKLQLQNSGIEVPTVSSAPRSNSLSGPSSPQNTRLANARSNSNPHSSPMEM